LAESGQRLQNTLPGDPLSMIQAIEMSSWVEADIIAQMSKFNHL
jgi:hypothetical protein